MYIDEKMYAREPEMCFKPWLRKKIKVYLTWILASFWSHRKGLVMTKLWLVSASSLVSPKWTDHSAQRQENKQLGRLTPTRWQLLKDQILVASTKYAPWINGFFSTTRALTATSARQHYLHWQVKVTFWPSEFDHFKELVVFGSVLQILAFWRIIRPWAV